ncbi:MAG: ArsR/SmtB family transcription factor [Candidatus Nanohaloarchaea archaeon]
MDLDFQTVKALSSPTRIKILSQALKTEATTTQLSREIGKSKSTVSSHLDTLVDSGLLKKDEEDGRKRVVYRPTEKAEAIVKGKQRKVRFSVASSAVTGLAGLTALGFSRRVVEQNSPGVMTMDEASREVVYSEPLLFVSAFFMAVAVSALVYGLTMKKLPEVRTS